MPGRDLRPAARPAEVASNALKPPSTRRKTKPKAHLPLLWRESGDVIFEDDVRKVEGDPEERLNVCNIAKQASTSDTQQMDANADFAGAEPKIYMTSKIGS